MPQDLLDATQLPTPARFVLPTGKLWGFVGVSVMLHLAALLSNFPDPLNQVAPPFTDTALTVQFFTPPQTAAQKSLTQTAQRETPHPANAQPQATSQPSQEDTMAKQLELDSNLSHAATNSMPTSDVETDAPSTPAEALQTDIATPNTRQATREAKSNAAQTAIDREIQRLAQQRRTTLQHVQHLLTAQFHYPRRARQFGWQGEVRVGFHVSAQGQVANIYLARSSGYALLDQSAMDAVARLKTIARPDNSHPWQDMDLELPVIYQLQNG